ncbi:helix-turn-helix transcriptional regulator [Flavobacterium adhaerens]|uniref:helix-turn-helix transcriptional regulator n=1 Tax=Flavobacterium adhaerens TaxID=3149043 RepID=UPI0032B583D9
MKSPHNQERIVSMYQMLFEMARGNFNSRIPLSPYDDELETLVILINMVAEEMKESIFHGGYVNSHSTHRFIAQTSFILDDALLIKSFTPEVISFLGYLESDLLNQPLSSILTKASMHQLQEVFAKDVRMPTMIQLDFTTKDNLLISVSCSIGKLINRPELILSLVTPVPQESYNPMVNENDDEKQIKPRKSDAFLIQKLYDYILAHLEEPLPSLKELSRQFGSNEYKLKEGFRYFFKTSIYQFYNEERLKRAHFMIENTTFPLKNISEMNGFNNYPNFSKSFKKRYGYSPYELNRNDIDLGSQSKD